MVFLLNFVWLDLRLLNQHSHFVDFLSRKHYYLLKLKSMHLHFVVLILHSCKGAILQLYLETKIINAPITGHPLFYIKSKISIPSSITITDFQEKLNKIADTTNVAIKLVEFDENFNH